jgi:hypothetical protein
MAYLRVETTGLNTKEEGSPLRGKLLTPSSAGDGRRASIASSNWSFVFQQSSTSSHSPSVASFQSAQEPCTPPQHGLPMEFSFDAPATPYDDLSLVGEPSHPKAPYIENQMMLQNSSLGADGSLHLHSKAEWLQIQQQDHSHDQQQLHVLGADDTMPASNDFSTTLGAGLNHGLDHSYTQFWMQQYPNSVYAPGPDNVYRNNDFQTPPHQGLAMMYGVPTTLGSLPPTENTIIPTQTIMEDTSPINDCPFEPSQDQFGLLSPRSEYQLSPHSIGAKDERDILESEDGWKDPETSRTVVVRSGAKGLKKEVIKVMDSDGSFKKAKKRGSSGKRKRRQPKVTHSQHTDGNVLVEFQRLSSSKKNACTYVFSNGNICARACERVEHLRRHEKTHSGERPFGCPKCHKPFGRRDNWRDHLKTHLWTTSASRNEPCSFEDMCDLVSNVEEGEEASKTFKVLEEWMEKKRLERKTAIPVARSRS